MRSPAERLRKRGQIEGALRGVAAATLAAALIIAWLESRRGSDAAGAAHMRFDSAPSPSTRDSLAALARAARTVSWEGALAPLGVMVEPVREPGDRWRISALGSADLLVRDSLGPVDSLAAGARVLSSEATRGPVRVIDGNTEARALPADVAQLRRVLVLGRAGWETRFTITALEEAGWLVDANLDLGRNRAVRQGPSGAQLARHSVVIVFDSAQVRREAAALVRFVRGGGGLILADEALRAEVPALRALSGAPVAGLEAAETQSFEGHDPLHALPLVVLRPLRADAVLLEDREGTPSVVARRIGAGRLIQLGYRDTWRWRMEGEGRSVEQHRVWWSRLVGLAADAEYVRRASEGAVLDPAPLAALTHSLGAPIAEAARGTTQSRSLPAWLAPLILITLLAEWASRRARGAA